MAALAQRPEGCLICALRDGALGDPLVIARAEGCTALLPRYALRRGHVMVLLDQHVERMSDVDAGLWQRVTALAHGAACTLERVLQPARCYVASLGTSRTDLPMTSPHIHVHVIPIEDADAKPSRVLTWEHGVFVADEAEWQALRVQLGFSGVGA